MGQRLSAENKKFLIAVHRAMNVTFLRYQALDAFFASDWEAVFRASLKDFQECGVDKKGMEQFFTRRGDVVPEQEIEKIKKCGAQILLLGEENFPAQLAHIPSPPVILFLRGELHSDDFPSLSVVGSRNISSYGKRALESIVSTVAQKGITIVSGLALGADTIAHRVAVKNGARTICVLGNGIDSLYPAQNRAFGEKLLAENKGAVISEFLPEVEARPEHFPIRNRIVAGLSSATLVVEAQEKSGSLITAQLANDQGKEVFAVPGEIFSPNSAGTNQLLLNGEAAPALSGEQILDVFGITNLSEQKNARRNLPTTGIESEILRLFGDEHRMHVDDLIRDSELAGPAIGAHLSIMEIKGLVKHLGNHVYGKNV
jgi:DNA processing protein